ncbi:hypothetical protein M8C21_007455 [Ambrosia artemisiifolia]|uniref:Uncharacterized protein n=1 Tax=Ambrosia artemisiifolia TaxID=4212 RepID=A0AAD5GSJ7_AMBAR|nr:hypothetical protein M8C21_007455 [Ambrosia artemisiifolia]
MQRNIKSTKPNQTTLGNRKKKGTVSNSNTTKSKHGKTQMHCKQSCLLRRPN